jgi:hypothetical protein
MTLVPAFPAGFDQEFGRWLRLEPRSRANDLARGIEARTADPLWMLARQWQTGEFDAEDAGSPISVRLAHATQSLDRVKLGAAAASALPAMPLETAVECERVPLDWRMRVRIGQQFERFARSALQGDAAALTALLDDFRSRYGLILPAGDAWTATDYATRRFLGLLQGRVIDGQQLLDALKAGTPAPPSGVSTSQLNTVVSQLQTWWTALIVQPTGAVAPAWRNQQLDYRFEVNPPPASGSTAGTERIRLVAPSYCNGELEWHSFSAATGTPGVWTPKELTLPPTRIAVGGTSPRWWAFEDAATDFGALDVATPDLAKLLLMEFVLVYGDDWFSVPIEVAMPSLVRVTSLQVTNVFGEVLSVSPVRSVVRTALVAAHAPDPDAARLRWEVFTLSPYPAADPDAPGIAPDPPGSGDVLLIPPVTGWREESQPLEEVRLVRDEGANSVWGVEHIVASGTGRPVHGFDAQRERRQRPTDDAIAAALARVSELEDQLAAAPDDTARAAAQTLLADAQAALATLRAGPRQFVQGADPAYRLATSVPENWIPFLPASAMPFFGLATPSIRLQRAQMLRNTAAEAPEPIPAMTRLLSLTEPEPLMWLEEATVRRTGTRVQLTAQRTRWVDGKTYVWLGRKVLVGRGEGSSGLRFDVLNSSQGP